MSATEPVFTVTLTAGQIAELRSAGEEGAIINDDTIAALDAAKPVKRRRKAAAPVADEPLIVTGDVHLDEFVASHHRVDWRDHLATALRPRRAGMVNMPSPPPGMPRKSLTQQERADLYRVHVIRSVGV